MNKTPTLEISFEEQVNDLCGCFKYFNIYGINMTERTSRFFIDSGKSRTAYRFTRKHAIVANTEAEPILKGNLKLYPAAIQFEFINNDKEEESENITAKISLPLASELIVKYEPGVAQLDSWYQLVGLNRFELDKSLGLQQLKFRNKWKAYYPKDSAYSDGEFIYVCFEESDSWIAFRFESVSQDTSVIQILNHEFRFIVPDFEMKFYFSMNSDFVDTTNRHSYMSECAAKLEGNKLFNLSKLYTEAEEQIESFKYEQKDPYIDPDQLENSELNFLCGSEENLERMLTLICHAAIPIPLWDKYSELEFYVQSSTDDGDEAQIDYDSMSYSSIWADVQNKFPTLAQHIENAFDTTLSENTPEGHSWEYNDGPYDRKSGYDRLPKRLTINISAPTAHEQICAKLEIKQFASVFGKEIIAGLLNQK
jgi:hypothetical protein